MIVGWLGLALLLLSYIILNTRHSKYFLVVDAVASFVLTIHAVLIQDIPFIIVNAFITVALIIKQYKGGIQ
jgi:hypothetical protein